MSLAERVKQIISRSSEAGIGIVEPTKKLSGVLSCSRVLDVLKGLKDQMPFELSNEIIENGKKMVIIAKWQTDTSGSKKRFVISVTEESISFIGNYASNNYKRLEGKEIKNGKLIENSLLEAFKDPSVI